MKKNVMRILAAVLALAMVFSLAACGNGGKAPSSSSGTSSAANDSSGGTSSAANDSSSEASSSEESSQASGAPADGTYATVKDFLEDPSVKTVLDAAIAQMVGDNKDIDVSLEGTDDTLIYVFKYSAEAMATLDADSLKAGLAEGLEDESYASTFEGIASSVSQVVAAGKAKVKVVYATPDGAELASKEYSAK